jgi:HNH endonuclease
MSYEEAWPLIQAGTYHEEKQRREADREADLKYLEAVVKDLDAIDKDPDLSPTEREVKGKARVGQSAYRKQMLELWGGKCAVTRCDLQSMLIASHAKAWAASSSKEKLDPHNGVPLVPTLDRLFDNHLISFHPETGDMLLAREIDTRERRMQLGISTVEKSLRKAPNKQQAAYLRHHFEAFMKKQRDKEVA